MVCQPGVRASRPQLNNAVRMRIDANAGETPAHRGGTSTTGDVVGVEMHKTDPFHIASQGTLTADRVSTIVKLAWTDGTPRTNGLIPVYDR